MTSTNMQRQVGGSLVQERATSMQVLVRDPFGLGEFVFGHVAQESRNV